MKAKMEKKKNTGSENTRTFAVGRRTNRTSISGGGMGHI